MAKPGFRSMKGSEVSWDPLYVGYCPFEDRQLALRRYLCDTYMDPRKAVTGDGRTRFYVDGITSVRDKAKAALNAYNEKEQKNLNLEKVVKINSHSMNSYLTFWARSAESEERHLFRAVVNTLGGGYNVLLCEIKDDEEITIPADHPEKNRGPISEEDQSPPPWGYLRTDGCACRTTDDINCGEAVGHGGINLG